MKTATKAQKATELDADQPLEKTLSPDETSEITGRGLQALAVDRMLGRGIPFIKCGRLVRYDPRDINNYLRDNRRATTG